MDIISTNQQLRKQLLRLINEYPKMAFATAWASANNDVFQSILTRKENIVVAVIGTHFYQTDPDVLDSFVDSKKVKFIMQPEGVFHPKVYIFWNGPQWEVIIGSANLTNGALSVNSELSIIISNQDGNLNLKDELSVIFRGYFDSAKTINQSDANSYRNLWNLKKSDLTRISGQYGKMKPKKLAIDSPVMSMNWPTFLDRVKHGNRDDFDDRVGMLEAIKKQFNKHTHFNAMDLDVRLGIAGLPSQFFPKWGWFGSMKGAGKFYQLIKEGHSAFSLALDQIPLQGDLSRTHFDRFIAEYLMAFPNGRDGLGTATRLLAMKRPDTFVCVDAANKRLLSDDLGIRRLDTKDYDRYWEEVILRLKDSPWWQSPEPDNLIDRSVWQGRAAMLDVIFYEH